MLSTLARGFRPAFARAFSAAAPIRETGYNFTLNDDEREIIDLAEKFTREEIIPNAPHHDRTGEFPWDIVKKAHSLGLMNLHVPQEYGGMHTSQIEIFLPPSYPVTHPCGKCYMCYNV